MKLTDVEFQRFYELSEAMELPAAEAARRVLLGVLDAIGSAGMRTLVAVAKPTEPSKKRSIRMDFDAMNRASAAKKKASPE